MQASIPPQHHIKLR